MSAGLSPAQEAVLATADKAALKDTVDNLVTYWQASQWLPSSNRYRDNCLDALAANPNPTSGDSKDLADYIGASVATHAMDGWQYLGKAIHAHLLGDPDVARHLGYYAELRAAMSLLAVTGIGVFNNRHFIVNAAKETPSLGDTRQPGTHVFAWKALDFWAGTTGAGQTVADAIMIGGKPLSEWLSAYTAGTAPATLALKDWISTWGLDLAQLTDDREARNRSSYRPTAFTNSKAIPFAQTLDYVQDFWSISSNGTFNLLDRFLLRDALLKRARGIQSSWDDAEQEAAFALRIKAVLSTVEPQAQLNFSWLDFLTEKTLVQEPRVFQEARGKLTPLEEGHDLQVIARATLLLHLASRSARKFLSNASVDDLQFLRFWPDALGLQCGMWDAGKTPTEFEELWKDVEESLEKLSQWRGSVAVGQVTLAAMLISVPDVVETLVSGEHAGFWALRL